MTGAFAVERMIEALLFAAAEPLSAADLAERLPAGADIAQGLAGLKARYASRCRRLLGPRQSSEELCP